MQPKASAKSVVHAKPEAVMEAFINPALMSQFWFHRRDEGLKQGESVMFYLGSDKDAFGFTAQVLELGPYRLLLRWGDESGWTEVL